MMTPGPPSRVWPLPKELATRIPSGSRTLNTTEALPRSSTRKSARSRDFRIRASGGGGGGLGLVTDLTSSQPNEDIFQRHRAVGDGLHPGISPVLLDEPQGRPDREEQAVVDYGDPIAHRLGFLHGMRGKEDASSLATQLFNAAP